MLRWRGIPGGSFWRRCPVGCLSGQYDRIRFLANSLLEEIGGNPYLSEEGAGFVVSEYMIVFFHSFFR